MKNFKRAMVLGMVAVGMISLIGCGQKEEIVTDNAPQEITAEETKEVNGHNVTIKGNDKINLIMWTDSGYSYAIGIPKCK